MPDPAARPRSLDHGPLMTQADVDDSLRRVHRASKGTACVAGCVIAVELSRHNDRRSLQARLLIADAEHLYAQLGEAIARARSHQQDLDLSDADIAAAQHGGRAR